MHNEDQHRALVDQRTREAMAVEIAALRIKAAAHDEALAIFENANKPTPGNLIDYVKPLADEFNRMFEAEPALRRDAERDAARAEVERLKREIEVEEDNCPYPDFSCGTFAAERGIELRPAGGPTYTTTVEHWQGILRERDAAQSGEARAVEALEAEQRAAHWRNLARITDKHEDHLEATRLSEIAQNLRHGVVLVGNPPSLAWLAQQRGEAAAEALMGLKDSIRGGTYRPHVAWRCISTRAAALRAGATGGKP